MATFNPPTRLANPGFNPRDFSVAPAANRLGAFFGPYPVGRSVIDINGTFTIVDTPLAADLLNLVDGKDYFLGGRVYIVSGALADRLDAEIGGGAVESNPYANGYGDPY